ncbi:MAG: MBL fold metallo-hydrolase [Thermoplasmata archaeon]
MREGRRVGLRLEELAPGLLLIHAPMEGRIPYAHSILVPGEPGSKGSKGILVDTGLGPWLLRLLKKRFAVGLVLNSHYHRDHTWGNYLFKNVPIKAHSLDAPMLNSMRVYFRMMGLAGRRDAALIKRFTLTFIPHTPGPHVGTFDGGEVFEAGGVELEVIHLPGHSPGHCGFLQREARVLFSADIVPDDFGPWYGHACSSMEDFASSINRIIAMRPDILVPAHGSPIRRRIVSRLRKYRDKIRWRERRLLSLLESPLTLAEILARHPFYGRSPAALRLPYSFWEETMVVKHLEKLVEEGEVEKRGARFVAR